MIDKVKKLLYFKEKLNIMNTMIFVLKEKLKNSAKLLMDTLTIEMENVGITLDEEYMISMDEKSLKIKFFIYIRAFREPHIIELLFLKKEEDLGGEETPCVQITVKWYLSGTFPKIEVSERTFFSKNFMNAFANVFSDIKASKRVTAKKFKNLEKTA